MYKGTRKLYPPVRPVQSYELRSSNRGQLINRIRFLEESLAKYADEIDTLNRLAEKLERQNEVLRKRLNSPEKYRLEEENRILKGLLRKMSEVRQLGRRLGDNTLETATDYRQPPNSPPSRTELYSPTYGKWRRSRANMNSSTNKPPTMARLPKEIEEFNIFL